MGARHHRVDLGRVPLLAVVLDAWGPPRGGLSDDRPPAELVLDPLKKAHGQRPEGVMQHSDQGCQYTALAFGQRCEEADAWPSMGSVGDASDTALCEGFFATLECELFERGDFRSHAEA